MTPTGYEVRRLQVRVRHEPAERHRAPRCDRRAPAPRRAASPRPTCSSTISRRGRRAPTRRRCRRRRRTCARRRAARRRRPRRCSARRSCAGPTRFVDVQVRQVLSHPTASATAGWSAQIVEGRLYLGPIEVNLPGGTAKLSIAYDPTKGAVDLAAGAYIERFDYGILARRLRRGDDVDGYFSLNLELTGTAPSLSAIMRHASGRIDFAIWPYDVARGRVRPVVGERHARAAAVHRPAFGIACELRGRPLRPQRRQVEGRHVRARHHPRARARRRRRATSRPRRSFASGRARRGWRS